MNTIWVQELEASGKAHIAHLESRIEEQRGMIEHLKNLGESRTGGDNPEEVSERLERLAAEVCPKPILNEVWHALISTQNPKRKSPNSQAQTRNQKPWGQVGRRDSALEVAGEREQRLKIRVTIKRPPPLDHRPPPPWRQDEGK